MQKKQTILVVASLLVVVLSVTLAYFTAQIIGKGKDVLVTSTDLKIIFTDTDGNIEGSNITPGWSNSKTFTIKNDTKTEYKYNIVIKDLLNTFVTNGYLKYKITSTNDGYNMTEFKDIPKSSAPKDKVLAYSVVIPNGVTQSYTIEFKYVNDESVDQSIDMGKKLSGTLFITEGTKDIYAGYEEGTLGYQIMRDNPTRSTRDTYDAVFTNNTTGTLFTATEKNVHNTTDTTVYYYAGNTTNNWVKFGTFASDGPIRGYVSATSTLYKEYTTLEECNSASSYNINCSYAWKKRDPMYWRIIRTNADGSVRLLYSGTSHDTTDVYLSTGTSVFNYPFDSPKYVGYMYGENDDTLVNARTNTNNSTIKTAIDKWYASNMTSYTKYLSTTAVYCNDRTEQTSGTYNTGGTSFDYAPYARAYTNYKPTYDCTEASDAFSIDNTSAKLTYPIALMTSDEIMRAGGKYLTSLTSPYAWYSLNSANGSITGRTSWWLLSPVSWRSSSSKNAYVFSVSNFPSYGFFEESSINSIIGVRPAISLKSCTLYSTGDGTSETPYEIVETPSGC